MAEIRHILERNGGNLGTDGSVAWQFDRKGQVYLSAEKYDEDRVFDAALEAGAEDVGRLDAEFVVTTDAQRLHEVKNGLEGAGLEVEQAEISMIAKNEIAVAGREAEKLVKVLDLLDDHDDVQKVHSNGDIDEAVLAEL